MSTARDLRRQLDALNEILLDVEEERDHWRREAARLEGERASQSVEREALLWAAAVRFQDLVNLLRAACSDQKVAARVRTRLAAGESILAVLSASTKAAA